MSKVICSSTSLVYLYRTRALKWLPKLFDEVWEPSDVLDELQGALFVGLDVPHLFDYPWIQFSDPQITLPAAFLAEELSPNDLVVMSLAFEIRGAIVVLDDAAARKSARAAGLTVWGTLRVMLEAHRRGFFKNFTPYVERLNTGAGMWLSEDLFQRIRALAGEADPDPMEN
ncbi:MAG: DUF3368 domain-containing protein [Anaerolineales bacterium]|nr:DUF3368 domain-containing protein [Anaerolineales bacterium]